MAGHISEGNVIEKLAGSGYLEIDNIRYILYTGNDNKNISGVPGIMALIEYSN